MTPNQIARLTHQIRRLSDQSIDIENRMEDVALILEALFAEMLAERDRKEPT